MRVVLIFHILGFGKHLRTYLSTGYGNDNVSLPMCGIDYIATEFETFKPHMSIIIGHTIKDWNIFWQAQRVGIIYL